MATTPLAVRVEESTKAHLEAEAQRNGMSLSDHVRAILERHVTGQSPAPVSSNDHIDGAEILAEVTQTLGELRGTRGELAELRANLRRAVAAILTVAGDTDRHMTVEQAKAWVKKNLVEGQGG